MRSKKGVKNVRKKPSERIHKDAHQKLLNLAVEIGFPCPVVPKSWKHRQDEYWQLMRDRVDASMKLIAELNVVLDTLEEHDPEFAKKLPWYHTRKLWKANGGTDEETLRIQLLCFHQDNFLRRVNSSLFIRYPSRDAYDKEEIRDYMRKLTARRKAEKAKAG
jgi:hypothetical protein